MIFFNKKKRIFYYYEVKGYSQESYSLTDWHLLVFQTKIFRIQNFKYPFFQIIRKQEYELICYIYINLKG